MCCRDNGRNFPSCSTLWGDPSCQHNILHRKLNVPCTVGVTSLRNHTGCGKTDRMECQSLNLLLLLLLLASLSSTKSATLKTLSMAPNAVDDSFSECREKMLQMVTKGGLLQKEFDINAGFKSFWNTHHQNCNINIADLTSDHLTALQLYGNSRSQFRKLFNDMVSAMGGNSTTYKEEFQYKSLHFLLTDALQLLNKNKTCHNLWYGTGNHYTVVKGEDIRFGRFLLASSKKNPEIHKIEEDNGGTLFNITSCSAVNLDKLNCKSEIIDYLISPNEVFKVMNFENAKAEDGTTYKKITLTHSGFLSNHTCYLFPSTNDLHGSSAPLLIFMPLIVTASLLSLWH